jgi:hypothetical protein
VSVAEGEEAAAVEGHLAEVRSDVMLLLYILNRNKVRLDRITYLEDRGDTCQAEESKDRIGCFPVCCFLVLLFRTGTYVATPLNLDAP